MPLILCPRITGQLGNRLTALAHVLAACRVMGWQYANPFFDAYAGHFVQFRRSLTGPSDSAPDAAGPATDDPAEAADPKAWLRTPVAIGGQVLARGIRFSEAVAFGKLLRVKCPDTGIDLTRLPADQHARVNRAWIVSLQGYRFRSPGAVRMERPWLTRIFQPIAAHRVPAERIANRLRTRSDVLVGIHIRQGDYATHQNGRFFYELPVYRRLAERMVALLAPKRVAFLVCANAPVPVDTFPGLTWDLGPGHFVADLHALSQCDHLLGPPSSFSTWAAFMGHASLYRVEDPAHPFTLGDFLPEEAPEPTW